MVVVLETVTVCGERLRKTRACLEELMHSDEDMLGLLLTETKELEHGEVLGDAL